MAELFVQRVRRALFAPGCELRPIVLEVTSPTDLGSCVQRFGPRHVRISVVACTRHFRFSCSDLLLYSSLCPFCQVKRQQEQRKHPTERA